MKNFIVFLLLISTLVLRAATGDVVSVTIDTNGWNAFVVFSGLAKGGTYANGLSGINSGTTIIVTNTLTGNEKFKLYVTSAGYTTNAGATTYTRTIYGTKVVRKAYPNNSTMDENDGVNTTNNIALSDHVSSADTVTYDIAAGFYTKTTANNAGTGSCVNNSLIGYPKTIGNWTWYGFNRETNAFMTNRCFAYEQHAHDGRPVACVVFTWTDEFSHAVSKTVTAPTLNRGVYGTEFLPVAEYIGTVALTNFIGTNKIRCDFKAYPWIGNSASLLDTTDAAHSMPDGNYCTITNFCDRSNTYSAVIAVVDPVNGSDTTGRATNCGPTQVIAANIFATTAKASAQIALSNQVYHAHTDTGGGKMYIKGPTGWMLADQTHGGTPSAFLEVLPYPGDSTAAITNNATGSSKQPAIVRFSNLLINSSGANTFSTSSTNTWIATCFDNCTLSAPNVAQFSCASGTYGFCPVYVVDCSVPKWGQGFSPVGTGKDSYALIRGNNLNGFTNKLMANVSIGNYVTVSNAGPNFYSMPLDLANQGSAIIDRGIMYNNYWGCCALANGNCLQVHQSFNITNGLFIGNNVFEGITNNTGASTFDFGSKNGIHYTNVCVVYNTVKGFKTFFGYNDDTTSPSWRIWWQVYGNFIDDYNIKDDTHNGSVNGQNGARVGNWSLRYGAGYACNVLNETAFVGAEGLFVNEFCGLNSMGSNTPSNSNGSTNNAGTYLGFINDLSWNGVTVHVGGGNYNWHSDSAVHHIKTLDVKLPYDLSGNARGNRSPVGPYAEADLNK